MRCKPGLRLNALLIVFSVTTARDQARSQLFAFGCDSQTGVCANGENPNSLIQSADGNFYGTTSTGGIGNNARGTVFKITSSGQLTSSLHLEPTRTGIIPTECCRPAWSKAMMASSMEHQLWAKALLPKKFQRRNRIDRSSCTVNREPPPPGCPDQSFTKLSRTGPGDERGGNS